MFMGDNVVIAAGLVIDIIFDPLIALVMLPLDTPDELEAKGCVKVPTPDVASIGVTPTTGLELLSKIVKVMIEVLLMPKEALSQTNVEFEALAVELATNVVVEVPTPVKAAGDVIDIVFVSAVVDAIYPNACPFLSVYVVGCTSVLFVPVLAKVIV